MGRFAGASLVTSGELMRRTFDAVAEVRAVRTREELETLVHKEFQALGYEVIIGTRITRRREAHDVEFLFGKMDHPWVDRYVEADYGSRCPVVAAAGPRPVTWGELRQGSLSPRQQRMFEELREFSLHDGHIVAVDRADGSVAAVSLAGGHIDLADPYVRTATHVLSTYYGLIGFGLLRGRADDGSHAPALTERQRECLKWVRAGKSSKDIGDITGLSARTVDEHLGKACRVLGVRTRVQAVAEAALLGLIDL